jgi:hypothetical protein
LSFRGMPNHSKIRRLVMTPPVICSSMLYIELAGI